MRRLPTFTAAILSAALAAMPVAADEIEETIEAALAAYRSGDIATAKEELDYAAQLVAQLKAEGLAAFLPEPMDGWTREMQDTQSAAMFGGGLFGGADYRKGNETVSIQIIAESPMVMSMGAILSNPAMMAMQGRVTRIKRERFLIADDQITGLIGNKVLIQVSGSAPEETKLAYIEAMDLRALADF
jgi:hypothetical protein